MMSEKLEGKVAIISGAASGMGESHARRLAKEGAKVVLGDIADKEGQALAEEIGEDKALFVHLNVADYDSWVNAAEETVKTFGSLDVLVNNAGILTRGNAVDATVEDWQKTIDIDLTGAFYGIKASVPAMREAGGGSIINISSIAGLVGFKNRLAYAAAKWGVHGMTKTSALDFGPDNIRVNSVHPGSVRTPLTAGLKRGFGQIPLGRDADVNEISNLIVFLASDDSAFISGANIAIDGGETAGNNLREDS
ncbi:glucose 1-dehydrogenase [Gleimia hominis]|uniref:glucose 1-dehydrogenase n=1 Tax=Gleimia hominis TaxID=595468 RepID=UPI0018ECF4D6|nr:glucose 1-dehydrogenase [Gleimia hominis]WIK64381.1 SDR family oxidoreductase [Gleimia hominis]